MKSKLISIIKNLTLEQVNKNLLLVALLSLLFRVGNFAIGYIPKTFEVIFALIVLLTAVDLLKNNKIKEFFFSIPRNIRIAVFCLVSSILIGWVFATAYLKIPLSFNMLLEFGTFIISLGIFILIIFYTRNDKTYIKKYFYALLAPVVYIFFMIFPEVAYHFNFALGNHFVGFTSNPNIVSKILLIPAMFFIVSSLFEIKNKWFQLGYVALSSFLVFLLFWTSSRGAILSLILGTIFIWLIFSLNNFNWKKLLKSGIIVFLILFIGFILTPSSVKNVILNRISNTEISIVASINSTSESRLQIWSFYLKYVSTNPLGIGPNTHMNFNLMDNNGNYLNLGPHNTYLQIWLWGGLLGLLSFIYILISAFKNLFFKLKSNFDPITVALTAVLFTLLLSIMFDDSLSFYWLWVILALSFLI